MLWEDRAKLLRSWVENNEESGLVEAAVRYSKENERELEGGKDLMTVADMIKAGFSTLLGLDVGSYRWRMVKVSNDFSSPTLPLMPSTDIQGTRWKVLSGVGKGLKTPTPRMIPSLLPFGLLGRPNTMTGSKWNKPNISICLDGPRRGSSMKWVAELDRGLCLRSLLFLGVVAITPQTHFWLFQKRLVPQLWIIVDPGP